MSLKDQISDAAKKSFAFGREAGLEGALLWGVKSLPVVLLERGREEVLMQGGYHVAREVAVMVRSDLIGGMTQREKVNLAGECWLVAKMTAGPHGFTKLLLNREGL